MLTVRRRWWAKEAPPEKRLGYRPDVLCDDCQIQNGSERHHFVYKSATSGNEALRELSEHPALSAFLCNDCHLKADSEEKRLQYWNQNKEFFGTPYKKVFDDVLKKLKSLGIDWRWE
jgi:hypothetical protein